MAVRVTACSVTIWSVRWCRRSQKSSDLTKKLFDAGAQLFLGTDLLAQPLRHYPEPALLEEMALVLSEAGMRRRASLEARDARCGRPARYRRGWDGSKPMRRPIFYCFRHDPTEAIGNISSLEAVVAAGKLYRIADLHRALQSNQAYFTSPLIRPLARRGAERALAQALGRSRS